MKSPEEGAGVDGGFTLSSALAGRQAQPTAGGGLLCLSLGDRGCWIRHAVTAVQNGEGPLIPINFCESGFL